MISRKYFSVVAGILSGTISAHADICGNNNTGGTTPQCDPCEKACSANSIALYTGNERRTVRDLEIHGGVGEHKLEWIRYGNSRMSNGVNWLGNGHNWRHSYQWECSVASDTTGPLTATISYPNGAQFKFTRIGTTNEFLSVASATERLALNEAKDTFTLTNSEGWKYVFGITPSKTWRLNQFVDSQQNAYVLTYDTSNRVAMVKEPAGRYLKITYASLSINAQNDTQLASIATADDGSSVSTDPLLQPPGLWNVVPSASTTAFRYLRYQGPDTKYSTIAEIRFRNAAGQILAGSPFGGATATNPGYEFAKAFDSDTNTFFTSSIQTGDFTGLDLGTAQTIGSMEFYVPHGASAALVKGRFLATNNKPATVTVISKVETSDGRSVTYDYGLFTDSTLPINWRTLLAAHYGDGTTATYTYTQAYPSTRPLLASASDPRVVGQGTRLAWEYGNTIYNVVGFTVKEKNAVTGSTILAVSNSGDNLKATTSNGAVQTYAVNHANGLLNSKTDALGKKTTYVRDQAGGGFVLSSTDPLNRVTQYTRTLYGNILTETAPDGSVVSWTRDDLDLILTKTDELCRVITYTRDAQHRISRIDYPDQSFETFTYNNFGQVLDHQLRNGGIEHTAYDARGLKVSHTDAIGYVTAFTYTVHSASSPAPADLLASVTDANGRQTSFEYDERGQLIGQLFADATHHEFAYDPFGNRISMTDELGHIWNTGFDEFNRKVSVTDPLGRATTFDYSTGPSVSGCGSCNMMDKPTSIVLPSGKITRYTYDLAWQKLSETIGFGTSEAAVTSYLYDAVGNVTKVTDPLNHVTTFVFDSRNRRTKATDALGNITSWSFDLAGNLLTTKRPDNGVTSAVYDVMNRVVSVSDPKQQTTRLTYDAQGNLITLTDARGSITQFSFDLRNQRTRKTCADGSFESWTYDAVGSEVTRRTPSGKVATSTYDSRNRLTLTDWSDNTPDVARAYDAEGRLVSLISSASVLSYQFNAANELLSETQEIKVPQAQPARTVSYRYDSDGNRAALVYPDGTESTYTYTARNQLAAISAGGPPPLASYVYDLAGNRKTMTLENGVATTYAYDVADRLLSINHGLNGGSLAINYGLNSVGNRTSRSEVFAGQTRSETYGYDAIDQLTETRLNPNATADQRRVNYAYDAAGNRSTVTEDADGTGPLSGSTTSYTANALNQYTAISALAAPVHDIDGNLTSLQAKAGQANWSYQYDGENRLIAGTDGTTSFQFAYDAHHRCVSRTINGVTTYQTYDVWSLLEERTAAGNLGARYIHGASIDEIVATVTSNGARYFHQDALGSVIALSDSSGVTLEKVRYDAYGLPEFVTAAGQPLTTSPSGNRFLFTGREWFAQLGLQDSRNRYYQPAIGRWLSRDPIAEKGGLNLYAYVSGNPVNFVDPLGLCDSKADCAEKKGFIALCICHKCAYLKITNGRPPVFPDGSKADERERMRKYYEELNRPGRGKGGTGLGFHFHFEF